MTRPVPLTQVDDPGRTPWGVAIGPRKLPALRASESAATVTEVTRSRANTEASGPKAPPVSHASAPGRVVLTAIEEPRSVPETAAPKR
jgi:hypothetical protein